MAYKFPSAEWLQAFEEKLNSDEKYARVARNWEGDILFVIEADRQLATQVQMYLDLWHGKCRQAFVVDDEHQPAGQLAFTLTAPYGNFVRILEGKLDPLQAMLTRKLRVQGSMAYMMRNVPVVLDFVRCAREVPLAG